MHNWGDEDVDWDGINDAATYISHFLTRWGRINVMDYKEKFGTVRVYCYISVQGLYWLINPRGGFYRWNERWKWTTYGSFWFWKRFNFLFNPWQRMIYRLAYRRAIKKWPHLTNEILSCADYPALIGAEKYWKDV